MKTVAIPEAVYTRLKRYCEHHGLNSATYESPIAEMNRLIKQFLGIELQAQERLRTEVNMYQAEEMRVKEEKQTQGQEARHQVVVRHAFVAHRSNKGCLKGAQCIPSRPQRLRI